MSEESITPSTVQRVSRSPGRHRRTTPPRSRSSKGSRRSASAPACTSAPPVSGGCTTWCWEVVDNSVDEALAGYCDRIVVTVLEDGGVEVVDNGRGIPVDIHPVEGIPAVTVVLTVLHAGGKFGGGGYKVSGGLHGVGVSVVNALSQRLEVEIKRDGYRWTQSFTYGVPDGDLVRHEATHETGTTTRFWASEDIFETTDYNFETITNRFREMAFLNKGLEIVIRDRRQEADEPSPRPSRTPPSESEEQPGAEPHRSADGTLERTFKFDRGLVDYVEHLNRRRDPAHPSVIDFEAEAAADSTSGLSLEIAMQWNTGYTESVHTFANTINTHEGGTHEEGFRSALTSLVNNWGEEWGLIKKKEDRRLRRRRPRGPHRDHLGQARRAAVRGPDQDQARQHRGQGRSCSGSSTTSSATGFEKNPAEGKDIVRKAMSAAQAADRRPQGARARPRPQGAARRRRPPGKLADCQSHEPRGVRDLRRRGRLRRRLGQGWPRPADPGDPPDPRQDPQRREGPHRQGAGQQRGPGDHLRARHRHPRRVRPREGALPQDRDDGRRRRRRSPHPHAAADAAVPVHEAAHRGRLRLPRAAAALPAAVEQAARPRVRLLRRRARRDDRRPASRPARSCPRRTRSSATRGSAR